MKDKIKAFIAKVKYWWSKESCYDEMERRGIAAMGCCSGVVGGDQYSGYLSYTCIDCPHFVNVRD